MAKDPIYFGHLMPDDERALEDMKSQGAVLVDPANVPNMDNGDVFAELPSLVLDYEFKAGINAYLESLGPEARMKSLEDLIAFNGLLAFPRA